MRQQLPCQSLTFLSRLPPATAMDLSTSPTSRDGVSASLASICCVRSSTCRLAAVSTRSRSSSRPRQPQSLCPGGLLLHLHRWQFLLTSSCEKLGWWRDSFPLPQLHDQECHLTPHVLNCAPPLCSRVCASPMVSADIYLPYLSLSLSLSLMLLALFCLNSLAQNKSWYHEVPEKSGIAATTGTLAPRLEPCVFIATCTTLSASATTAAAAAEGLRGLQFCLLYPEAPFKHGFGGIDPRGGKKARDKKICYPFSSV